MEAETGEQAIELGLANRPDIVVVDLILPRLGGLGALSALRSEKACSVGIAISGVIPNAEARASAVAAGAVEFFSKPFDVAAVVTCAESHLAEQSHVPSEEQGQLVGKAPGFLHALNVAARGASTQASILIEGETGTGKELLARDIHRRSGRRGAFVAVNCAALPRTLIESELFGTERGAFTEAISRPGAVELSSGGTLFLDEIGDLPAEAQGVLLRVLDQRVVHRLGSVRDIPIDLRVVVATNVDLADAVRRGRFRSDLYFRLSQLRVVLPALRDRPEDVLLIADSILRRVGAQNGAAPKLLSDDARERLVGHRWPGNVRELQNTIFRATLAAPGPYIAGRDLQFDSEGGVPAHSMASLPEGKGLLDAVHDLQRDAERVWILQALDESGGSMSLAARRLKIDRKTLYSRLVALGIRPSR